MGPEDMKKLNTTLGALALTCSAMATTAQAQSFGPEIVFGTGTSVTIDIATGTNTSGDGTLNVTLYGDFSASSELLDVSVEGTAIGQIRTGNDCGADGNFTLTIPAASFASAAADGTVSVTFAATTGVNNLCTPPASSAFAGLGNNLAYAVQGDLVGATASSGPGGPATETDMVAARAALITSNTVSTSRRIGRLQNGTGLVSGGLSFAGTQLASGIGADVQVSQNALNFASGFDAGNIMVWAEGSYTRFDDALTDDGGFGIIHVGADYLVNPNFMVGLSVQADTFEQTATSGDEFDALGWMVGPVATARLTQNLFLDGRLAYGQADNEITRGGSADEFDSTRMLAELSLIGQAEYAGFNFLPEAELLYFAEETEAYTSATLGAIAATEVEIAQARLGGQVEHDLDALGLGSGFTGYAELFSVFTSIEQGAVATGSFVDEIEGWTGEAAIGLRYANANGVTMNTSVGVGGLFSDAESVTAVFEINIPIQ